MKAKLLSVQAGQVRKVLIQGRLVPSALRKVAQSGPVQLGALGLLADEQADLSVHGGLDKAGMPTPQSTTIFGVQPAPRPVSMRSTPPWTLAPWAKT